MCCTCKFNKNYETSNKKKKHSNNIQILLKVHFKYDFNVTLNTQILQVSAALNI